MKYQKVNNGYLVKLERGEEIIKSLTEFALEENVESGAVSAIGAVSSLSLGYYYLSEKKYSWKEYKNDMEIASLSGNITFLANKPFVHVHAVFADEKNSCFGGHVKEAVVGATCEIFVTNLGVAISRKFDDEIGLNLLDI